MTQVQQGNTIQLCGSFVLMGAAYDPITVTFNAKLSSGLPLVSTTSVVRTGVGAYYFNFIPPVAGTYNYQFLGSGDDVSSEGNGKFQCVGNGY